MAEEQEVRRAKPLRLGMLTLAFLLPGLVALVPILLLLDVGPPLLLLSLALLVVAAMVPAYLMSADLSRLRDNLSRLTMDEAPLLPGPRRFAPTADIGREMVRARRSIVLTLRAMESRAAAAEDIVDSVPEPLLVLDQRRQIRYANDAAELLLGSRVSGRQLSEVIRDPALIDIVAATVNDGTGRACEFSLTVPLERELRARVAPLPRRGAAGETLVLTLEDLTTIRRSERMRADFVANVSHELKTPLATLIGFIETVRGPAAEDAEARAHFLGIMHEQARRMARIIDDLLSLSRIEIEEHNPPTDRVDLIELLEDVVDSLQIVAAQREMVIRLHPAEDLPPVRGDDIQLAQVFSNLVDNAIKYGEPGTAVDVWMQATAGARPDQETKTPMRLVSVTVADHGRGIPREHLARLTERFYRVDRHRSRELGGTGLGLAIVKHIVSRHRGGLSIDSRVGEGSRFTVTLPAG